jgi:hypothetical protein
MNFLTSKLSPFSNTLITAFIPQPENSELKSPGFSGWGIKNKKSIDTKQDYSI